MSRHDDSVSLRQMLDHAREATVMVQPHTRPDLNSNRMLTLALIQLAQIVGEAANRVSKAERERHAEIPWGQIIGLRNRLVHGYDSINFCRPASIDRHARTNHSTGEGLVPSYAFLH
jgi:uncharacterized protein with HEPN domain